MENSINECVPQQSFRSPVRRRRSTFFVRRDSFVPQADAEYDTNNCNDKTEVPEDHQQNLKRYSEKLLSEAELWKTEVINRRNKYHDLRKQCEITVESACRSRMSYSALSNEDIEYLRAKPNISKLVESQQKLHNSVNAMWAIYRRLNELEDVILNYSEDKVNKVTEHILENSTIEPMDE